MPRRVQARGTEADNIGMVRAALQQVDLPPEVGLQMRIARVTISDLGRLLSPLRIMVAQAAYTALHKKLKSMRGCQRQAVMMKGLPVVSRSEGGTGKPGPWFGR